MSDLPDDYWPTQSQKEYGTGEVGPKPLPNDETKDNREWISIPTPMVAPLGLSINKKAVVQEVWDAFVKPDQEAGNPQSSEMRCLMAILRAVYEGMPE